MEIKEKKKGLQPVVHKTSTLLILGSIPGDKSIELQQYYGHPYNRFWKLLPLLFQDEIPQTYADRLAFLERHHIALWDVADRAVRPGSLDSAIQDEEPNDLVGFLAEHGSIHTIAFNGKKAKQLYDRYFQEDARLVYYALPSTSPANAAFSLERLQEAWSVLVK